MEFVVKEPAKELNFHTPAFSAGQYAADYCSSALTIRADREWTRSTQHEKLFLAACAALGIEDGDTVKGCMALPLEWAKIDKPVVESKYNREWQIDDVRFSSDIETKAQGLLAIVNHAVDFDGSALDRDLLKLSVVCDIGGGTTDIAEIRNSQVGNRKGSLKGLGLNQVAEKVRQALKQSGISVSQARSRQIVVDKEYLYKGVAVPGIKENVERLISELADAAYSEITNKVPDLDEVPRILLTGGAGSECYPSLQSTDPRFFKGEYPFFDNALGALKGAMRNKKKDIVYMGIDIGYSHVKAVKYTGERIIGVCFRSVLGERVFPEDAR
jgi:hypothetical protein